jgi:hypothetical protein
LLFSDISDLFFLTNLFRDIAITYAQFGAAFPPREAKKLI